MNINMTVSAPSQQTLQQNVVFGCDVKRGGGGGGLILALQ